MPGIRVLVPLGRHDTPYIGLLMGVEESPPPFPQVKPLFAKLDAEPLYDETALAFFRWLVSYYMATPGDVAHVALPGRVGKIADWRACWRGSPPSLHPKKVYQQLRSYESFSIVQMARRLGLSAKKLLSVVRRWVRSGYAQLEPVVRQPRLRPPFFVEVAPPYLEEKAFQAAWESLPPASAQVFLELLRRTLRGDPPVYSHLRRAVGAPLRELVQRGLVRLLPAPAYYERIYARPLQPYTLTPAQQQAFEQVAAHLQDHPPRPILLHGITASGKTFVYMELMRKFLREGKQVLYLLPEIALTKQILDRLRGTFGEAMALYHSGLTEAERYRTWKAAREDAVDVVVGTRSALFLPLRRLGLIIVDEEHDPSFGQVGRAPLYQARDAAIYYAHLRQIPIVLGSATPSLETFAHARSGKYHYVPLKQKALPSRPPQLHVVDMRIEFQEKLSVGVFSSVLRELMEERLVRGEQAILFRNRRGYAPLLLCQVCGHRWECPDCAITLTYHKRQNSLICHYCGRREKAPAHCPVCGSDRLSLSGIGTERIEEQLQTFFPGLRVLRLDRDTTAGHTHEEIIGAFERGEADVLVGTQMVTKGLDFPRVTLVGVLYADSLVAWADFRAEERAYQLLVQLMGRAGRQGLESHIVIQTFRPETKLFSLLDAPYEAFAEPALKQREKYGYPPFRRLLQVNIYHKDPGQVERQAALWQGELRKAGWGEVLGPVYAPIPRIRSWYHMQILLKLPVRYAYEAVRSQLLQLREAHYRRWGSHSARITFHVDP